MTARWMTCVLVLGLAGKIAAQPAPPPEVPATAEPQTAVPRGQLTVRHDDFDQLDIVELNDVWTPIPLTHLRVLGVRGRELVTLSLVRSGVSWRYLECHRVQALQGTTPLALPDAEHQGSVSTNGVIEFVSLQVPLSTVASLGSGAVVRMRVCNDEFSLDPSQKASLLGFVEAMTSGRVPESFIRRSEDEQDEPAQVEAVIEPAPTPAPAPIPDAPPPPALDAPTDAGRIPVNIGLHGYYRARYNWFGNVPRQGTNPGEIGIVGGSRAHFAYQRLRLEPQITYGNDPTKPVAAVYLQIDALDNVVFGDNARIIRTPIFAADPSYTDYEGFDLVDSFRIERAWLEVLLPVGQLRVGRMPSQWGLGLLAHDGNGLGEWGDPLFGTTFDRVLFATRPLTVINALTSGDTRPTPLIFALAYDKLVEDPVRAGTDPPAPNTITVGPFGPIGTVPSERNTVPFQTWVGEGNDVNQMAVALLWNDTEAGPRSTDRFTLGSYYVYRWQQRGGALRPLPTESQASRVHIVDLYWKLDYGLGGSRPSIYTEGEIVHIGGRTNTVSLAGGCDDDTGICNATDANLWGGAFRAGARKHGVWGALLEWGFSSGDGQYFNDDQLRARPLHPDYHVGLIMYQVALSTMTSIGFGEEIRPLWSRGGVWNSHYMLPQFRFHLIPGFEVHTAVLAAWARELNPFVYTNRRADFTDTKCGAFQRDCAMGVEVDVALRVKWGTNDLLRWDTEVGYMYAGSALSGGSNLQERNLWTIQTRLAMVF